MKAPLRRIPARTLLAVATAAGLLFAVPAVASADPDNLPVLYGGDDSFAHQCKVIGVAVRGYEAVVCSDLQAGDGGTMDNPYYYVDGQTEVYCQTISGTVVGCEGLEVSAQLSSGAGVVGTGGMSAARLTAQWPAPGTGSATTSLTAGRRGGSQ